MTRLLIHVEGQTEETFVNEILQSHLLSYGYLKVSARLVGNARQRARRGGICPWSSVRDDILKHLKEDAGCRATTMVDYYALPQNGDRAWPSRKEAASLPFAQRAEVVERALLKDVEEQLGDARRFMPFLVMHEFEGLLFSDCAAFATGIGHPGLEKDFQNIRDAFASPEEINDSPITAPSKRVVSLVPNYEKPLMGCLAILEIGLERIRAECPRFKLWLEQLETWLL
ncbi:MAG: DUF4276 family protein [Deltaproteobacteria bacterium]|nr:DUF4276 family protein [Deltaproteobacteria bacterium]